MWNANSFQLKLVFLRACLVFNSVLTKMSTIYFFFSFPSCQYRILTVAAATKISKDLKNWPHAAAHAFVTPMTLCMGACITATFVNPGPASEPGSKHDAEWPRLGG